jgi:phosphatidyl-myo-inositol dimannoside synthase
VGESSRTLVLSEHFLPNRGGSITWLCETYRRFAPGEVVVVAGANVPSTAPDRNLPFKVERLRMLMKDWDPTRPASLWRYLVMLRHVTRSCHAHRASQIHCMKVLPEGAVAWVLRRIAGIPYLLYAHGEEIQMRFTSRKLGWLIPILYRSAAAIIANSHHTKRLLMEIGVDTKRIHVIHPGVDVSAFHTNQAANRAVRQRHNLTDAFILLTVGRLQRRKGHDMVIKALPRIKQQIPDAAYMIVGTGEEEAYLRDLAASLGVAKDVVFVGSIPDYERAAYYGACDVFLMPNRQVEADIEGFGIVFLEAGAAGKPVIGGLSGGTADAIQDGVTGVRVDGEKEREIVGAVVALAANISAARAMGERGRERVQAEFSWNSTVERTRCITAHVARGVY